MKEQIKLTVSEAMEFLYSLFALGTEKNYYEMISAYGLEPNNILNDYLSHMEKNLSRFMQQELKYFFDLSGLGYIFYKYIITHPDKKKIPEVIETINKSSADELVLNIIRSVCKNTLPQENTNEFAELSGNKIKLMELISKTKFQDDQRKIRVIEAVENPQEIKSRFLLLLTQFYDLSFKLIEGTLFDMLELEKEKYQKQFDKDPKSFWEQLISSDPSNNSNVTIHISFFKYVSCHSYSSYNPMIPNWFVLGIYSDLLFNESILTEKLANFFKVLSDANRIEILKLLSERSWFGQELADKLNISPPTVSYHMGFLQQIGLVSFTRSDNRFNYTLNKSKLVKPLEDFIKLFELK